ncbi:MAG: DinB family protein [Phycisphaerae bacterium]
MTKNVFAWLIELSQQETLPARLADIRDDQMTAQPIEGMNHPAWILGHLLALEHRVINDVLGLPLNLRLDNNWWGMYGIGSIPMNDRNTYKTKAFYMAGLAETSTRMISYLHYATGAQLEASVTDPLFMKIMPTIAYAFGAAANHRAYHTGQLAIWRKAMGVPHAGI